MDNRHKGYDWNKIKSEYASSTMSLKDIATKHKIPYTSVQKRSSKDKWNEARQNYCVAVVERMQKMQIEEDGNKFSSLIRAADRMSSKIDDVIADTDQFIIEAANGSKKLDTKTMRDLAATMKDLMYVIRGANDIPTKAEALAMEIAKQKLEIEKRRVEADEAVDHALGIVLMPPVLEDSDE